MNETLKELSEKIFFSKEAAEYLDISTQRLHKLVEEGKIIPFKKSPSGTLFYLDDLEERKKKQENHFKTEDEESNKKECFEIDTKVKNEALNFATLLNALNTTEEALEKKFELFCDEFDTGRPMIEDEDTLKKYADFFKLDLYPLKKEYEKAYLQFSKLRNTDEILKRGNQDYPPMLFETKEAPRFLYIRGNKSLLYATKSVSIVGSRSASDRGIDNTKRLVKSLGSNDIVIISGLARGIDTTAHKTALENNFNTIAVLGTNLNEYYPPENKNTQEEIEKKGLVVSQFSPATKMQKWSFSDRNGVMSALSKASIIIEASDKSGTLIHANFAISQKKEVLILKSAFEKGGISWPEEYIKKGAKVVETPKDVFSLLSNLYTNKESKNSGEYIQETFDIFQNEEDLNSGVAKPEPELMLVERI